MEQGHDSPLQIDMGAHGAKVTVIVAGELDITTATSMSQRLMAIGAAHPERLVLDLSGLGFIDVGGARALDEAYKARGRHPTAGSPTVMITLRPVKCRVQTYRAE